MCHTCVLYHPDSSVHDSFYFMFPSSTPPNYLILHCIKNKRVAHRPCTIQEIANTHTVSLSTFIDYNCALSPAFHAQSPPSARAFMPPPPNTPQPRKSHVLTSSQTRPTASYPCSLHEFPHRQEHQPYHLPTPISHSLALHFAPTWLITTPHPQFQPTSTLKERISASCNGPRRLVHVRQKPNASVPH